MRGIVLCLLGLVAVIGFLGSHRGGGRTATSAGGAGTDDGGRLRVEVADADVMEWTEENLTALARRSPEPPVSTCAPPAPLIASSPPTLFISAIIMSCQLTMHALEI